MNDDNVKLLISVGSVLLCVVFLPLFLSAPYAFVSYPIKIGVMILCLVWFYPSARYILSVIKKIGK